ncbi:hypothetical protein Tsubulata_024395 [Turnera subulata]|uniref:Uncharacterized protein n=1 Tax=Turnera subulata TaxID=218843 RepID=A0A9Q0F4E3_9ROSI|nr:hypothetical protein Tsubulata_024395 [Turnera subulata]
MKGGGRRFPGMPLNGRKDRDEDLLLFKELHKREKDRQASLLQPVSDEFESNNGNYALYRIASGKKGLGYEFFGENDKNDYDWLKTPPATPLFPSLEMEANPQQVVMQREIPILQPLSRFADNSEALKGSTGKPKSPNVKPNGIPQRSVTPSQRSSISSSTETKTPKATTPPGNQKRMTPFATSLIKQGSATASTENQKETQKDYLGANLSKDVKTKPISRGVSPSVRSTIPAQIPGFSNETPPNLRTDRATSATRGRPVANPTMPNTQQKPEPAAKPRRQSCSPSVTRGRKETTSANLTTQLKGKVLSGNNGNQIFGSRMVDKVMNARKLGAEEREAKPKSHATSNGNGSTTTGFGRMMARSSMDMAVKHMVRLEPI